jgi:alkylhydroperoxidase family enzyme
MPPKTKRRRETAATEHGPGLFRALTRSPAALAGYLGLRNGLAQGRLSAVEHCLIGLAVAQRSGGSYALSLQTRLAQQAGLTDRQILSAREGCAGSERHVALLFLAGKLVINCGELADADLAAARLAGLSDSEIMEAILHVALNLAVASVSHVARVKLDFPPAPPLPAF